MVAKKKESAEQKLLQMIEASGGSSSAGKKSQKSKYNFVSVIKKVNLFLIIILVFAIGLLANEIFVGQKFLKEKSMAVSSQKISKSGSGAEVSIPEPSPVSTYLAKLDKRNIFKPSDAPQAETSIAKSGTERTIDRIKRHLRLVGISWLDTVESAAVMLEDLKTNETHFLRKGDNLSVRNLGDILVKTIYADGVELGYENEEIIIRYDKD